MGSAGLRMSQFFTTTVLIATFASMIRFAAPFLLAALGETVGQRAGVLNLGVEGVMLLGAYSCYYVTLNSGSALTGVLIALMVGAVMGVVYAVVTLVFHAAQGISGIGVFLFGLGFTDLLFQKQVGTPISIDRPAEFSVPLLGSIPWIGEVFFQHSPLVFLAFALVPTISWMINRTTFGLNIRAVGETPDAADTLGVKVNSIRAAAIIIGNSMAGLAGAALVLNTGIFQQNLTSGQGFIAIALVYFGAWRAFGAMGGALLFGLVSAIVTQWKTLGIVAGSTSALAAMLPAILTIVVLVLVSKRIGAPAALTRPFDRAS